MKSVARVIGPSRLSWIGRRLRALPAASRLVDRADRNRSRRLERSGDARELARSRWRSTPPSTALTWGASVTGDAFVSRALAHDAFGPDRAVLEVGPGYGRILRSCLERSAPFRTYTGLDLSAENVRHLRGEFHDPRVTFVEGDAETAELPAPVDTILSSLTFKHMYPSFATALANLAGQLSARGLVLFDLIEGSRRYFHWDQTTYLREYSRPEIADLLRGASLEPVAFDTVVHDRAHQRLLVVARVPQPPAGPTERR